MRPVLVKAYGSLCPAGEEALNAVNAALREWFLDGAASLNGDLLRISHEGDYFPADDVVAALKPFVACGGEGKLDILDMEAWVLRRFFFYHGVVSERSASLDRALESCGH